MVIVSGMTTSRAIFSFGSFGLVRPSCAGTRRRNDGDRAHALLLARPSRSSPVRRPRFFSLAGGAVRSRLGRRDDLGRHARTADDALAVFLGLRPARRAAGSADRRAGAPGVPARRWRGAARRRLDAAGRPGGAWLRPRPCGAPPRRGGGAALPRACALRRPRARPSRAPRARREPWRRSRPAALFLFAAARLDERAGAGVALVLGQRAHRRATLPLPEPGVRRQALAAADRVGACGRRRRRSGAGRARAAPARSWRGRGGDRRCRRRGTRQAREGRRQALRPRDGAGAGVGRRGSSHDRRAGAGAGARPARQAGAPAGLRGVGLSPGR